MAIRVNEQLERMAGDIESAVASSRNRTMTLPAASPQVFGNATLSSWVDAAKRGVESAARALAADAAGKAGQLRTTATDFATTDGEAGSSFGPAGGPR